MERDEHFRRVNSPLSRGGLHIRPEVRLHVPTGGQAAFTEIAPMNIHDTEMMAGGPLADLLAQTRADLEEVAELAPGGTTHLERARFMKRLTRALEEARRAAPECETKEAALILGVSPRQARNLAASGKVKARRKSGDKGDWIFDVRSCHIHKQRCAA